MTVSEESIQKLPSPPFLHVDGIANFRDVGGYATSSSGSVRQGLLYRSGNPSNVTSTGVQTLQKLGLHKVFDLRSEPEVVKGSVAEGRPEAGSDGSMNKPKSPFFTSDPAASNGETMSAGSHLIDKDDDGPAPHQIERVWCPVFKTADYTSTATFDRYVPWAHLGEAKAIANGYMDIFENAGPAYRTVLEHLASDHPSPCLIHCTAGKDRTGGLAMLVLLLCGVDKDTIAKEYSLTKQGLGPILVEYKKRFMVMFDQPNKEKIIDIVLSSSPESMLATIDLLNKRYGGAEEYIKHVVGLDASKIEAVRRNMMTQQKAVL